MNKKILSIFALIMALSFAVSCSNENTTGNGGTGTGGGNPTAVKFSDVENAIKGLKTVTAETTEETIDFSGAKAASGKIALSIVDAGSNSSVTFANVKTALTTALGGLKVTGLTITSDVAGTSKPGTGTEVLTVTLTIKPSDSTKYALDKTTFEAAGCTISGDGSTTLKLEFTPAENWA